MINKKLGLIVLLALSLISCAVKSANRLPDNILGISIGMNRADVQNHLKEIAEFERDDRKQQQIWRLKTDPCYSHVALGFDKNGQVRYITVFADKSKERTRFSDIGDLSAAKKEILEPHRKFIWEIGATGENPAYFVEAYGNEQDFLTSYSLSKKIAAAQPEEEEEEESD
jgi:hypothetical protein